VLPVYNVEEKWLRKCIDSVIGQLYENWELCIADDASPSPHIKKVLDEYAASDKRIKVTFRPENGHISAASNSALELATGEYTVLLDHDDELSEDALFYVAKEIRDFPDTDMIYSDEDLIDEMGRRSHPKFKPDFSRDLFYSLNLITHISAYRTDILRTIGGFRVGLEGSQDYDLALRVIEHIPEKHIRHIPRVLYHWRAIRGSVAYSGDEKPYAHERARDALRAHFERTGVAVKVTETVYNLHRVRYVLPEVPPKVSLVLTSSLPPDDLEDALSEFLKCTGYPNFGILVIADVDSRKADLPPTGDIQIVKPERENTAASINAAIAQCDGEVLCFADLSFRPRNTDWLTELCRFATRPEIGAVGGRVLSPDGSVAAGGLIIGAGEAAEVAYRGFPCDFGGIMGRNVLPGNFSAVSGACMAIRRDVFERFGGLDEKLPQHLYDADLCLKIREAGFRVVFTPFAELITGDIPPNSLGKPSHEEAQYFRDKWKRYCESDPFYNPNLSKKDASFSIDA
jgi:GT2 family glycosyltransferase